MINTSIDLLLPAMQVKVKNLLWELKEKGIAVRVVETLRTKEVQQAYYMQGRASLAEVNAARKAAGLYAISASENKYTITNCDGVRYKSNHQAQGDGYGYAVDIVPLKSNGGLWWNAPEQIWTEIGVIAERHGLDWCAGGYGQTWGKGWDNPHFEYVGERLVK